MSIHPLTHSLTHSLTRARYYSIHAFDSKHWRHSSVFGTYSSSCIHDVLLAERIPIGHDATYTHSLHRTPLVPLSSTRTPTVALPERSSMYDTEFVCVPCACQGSPTHSQWRRRGSRFADGDANLVRNE